MDKIFLEEIDSTNNFVKSNITTLKHLTFVYADRQTSGRGRLERKWIDSGDANLFLTIVIKPISAISDSNTIQYANFTQFLSVVLSMVLEEEYKLDTAIKWPNDVLVKNKKIAGILAEGVSKGGEFLGMALGVGVNLNTENIHLQKIEKPATSIFNETGNKVDRDTFLEKLYSKFCLLYDEFVCKGFVSVKTYYETKFLYMNKEISINKLGEIHKGIVEGITNDGALVLRENQNKNTYYIGDIL